MASVHQIAPTRNILDEGAEDWESWTDEHTWELGPEAPTDEDEAWWLRELREAEVDERAAFEAAALDCMERGLIPGDVADRIARTSIVGHADDILHEGSDPSYCGCEPCVWDRTRRYAGPH